MKKSKVLKTLLVIVLIAGLFTSCVPAVQPSGGDSGGGSTAASESTVKTEQTTQASKENKPTLKWLIQSSFYDLDADAGYKALQEVSGYNIECEVLSGTEQLMLIVSSGEPYDYVYLNKGNYNMMLNNAALLDISSLLKEYGNEITSAITTLWPATTVDGKIYGIPSTVAQPNSLQVSIAARKDLMDKAGISMPTTVDGFYDCLVALKKAYPDMIPLTTDSGYGYKVPNISGGFGITGDWQIVDGKIIPTFKHPNMKAYVEYMRKLYSEGLLDPEMPALQRNDKNSKWTSGKAVMMVTDWNGSETLIGALRELFPDMELGVVPILAGADGTRIAEKRSGVGAIGAIPVTSKYPADSIKAINEVIKLDNFTKIALGEKGVHYNIDSNGNYTLIQPKFNEERINSNVFVAGFYREDVYPKMWEARLSKNADLEWLFRTFKASIEGIGVVNPVSLAPTVTVIDNLTALNTYASDSLNRIVAGVESLDSLGKIIEYWDANGGLLVEEFYNDWYNKK